MVQYYIFILKLRRNSRKNAGKFTYYTGVTTNPARRLSDIRNGFGCEWIRRNRLSAIRYVYMTSVKNSDEATKIKNRIKRLSLADKLALIEAPFKALQAKLNKE